MNKPSEGCSIAERREGPARDKVYSIDGSVDVGLSFLKGPFFGDFVKEFNKKMVPIKVSLKKERPMCVHELLTTHEMVTL